jgi:hypothetical protein
MASPATSSVPHKAANVSGTKIINVIDNILHSIDAALLENTAFLTNFRGSTDSILNAYEVERDRVDREIARLPESIEAYEDMKRKVR